MKRGLVFTLCALALAASAQTARAQLGALDVKLSLNLRYTDPANPAEGGIWSLIAKTGSADGIASVSAYISNITASAAVTKYGNGVLSTTASGYSGAGINAAGIAAILNGGNPFLGTFTGGAVNIVYGQDTAVGPIVLDVGSGTPNRIVSDALKNNTANGWGNAALIAQGTFTTASRPAFIPSGANSTDANVLPVGATTTAPQNASLDATTTTVVRGDSVSTLGLGDNLRRGDHTRDFAVNGSDLDIVLARFNQAVAAANAWDLGDNTNDNQVNGSDLDNVLAGFNTTQTPPSVGAASNVPEPGSLVMLALSGGMLALFRRR